ncbi:hypothetical protein CLOM_g19082 [Closterium sp. NIES-68]|nr:hypothetical protein CLOM_g19082 [Closterium sp. NIES-68]GJP75106.1 hypothetical protein CLOP_g5594 [Closterium sp. NIES-67]GJP84137.1 hypothetical protein CLOP_g14219 [Closterium sp. NIES-67]
MASSTDIELTPEVLATGVLPTLPRLEPAVASALARVQEKYGTKELLEAAMKGVKAEEPPLIIKQLFQIRGDLDVPLDDPEIARYLTKLS